MEEGTFYLPFTVVSCAFAKATALSDRKKHRINASRKVMMILGFLCHWWKLYPAVEKICRISLLISDTRKPPFRRQQEQKRYQHRKLRRPEEYAPASERPALPRTDPRLRVKNLRIGEISLIQDDQQIIHDKRGQTGRRKTRREHGAQHPHSRPQTTGRKIK